MGKKIGIKEDLVGNRRKFFFEFLFFEIFIKQFHKFEKIIKKIMKFEKLF